MSARLFILGMIAMWVGCADKRTPTAGAGSAAIASGAAPAPSLSEPPAVPSAAPLVPQSYPPDLKLDEITRKLDCSKGKTKNACDVCAQFGKAERFTGNTPSGEGRWFGRAYVVEKGSERSEYLMLVSRHVPTARVGPSSLPLMISTSSFAVELQVEAAKLWAKMNRAPHRGNRRNQAFRFLEAYVPKDEQGAINTTGLSTQMIAKLADDIGYLRQASLKKLLLVRPARGMNADPGDGTYAEFWQAVW